MSIKCINHTVLNNLEEPATVEKNSIFKTNECLEITHQLENKVLTFEIPIGIYSELQLSASEIDYLKRRTENRLDWLYERELLNESNYHDLYNATVSQTYHTLLSAQKCSPQREQIIDIFVCISVILTLVDDFVDDTEVGKEKINQVLEQPEYYTQIITGFLADVANGSYESVDDLPEELLTVDPWIGKILKLTQSKIDELKALDPNFKDHYQYFLVENSKIIQATFILMVNLKANILPKGLVEYFIELANAGRAFLELGIASFYGSFDLNIRNHVYFDRLKTLCGSTVSQLNSLFGLGNDYDGLELGIAQNPILRKWRRESNPTLDSLETLVKAEVQLYKESLVEINIICELFSKLFPNSVDVDDLVEQIQKFHNFALRAFAWSERYSGKRKVPGTTVFQYLINGEVQKTKTFHCEKYLLKLCKNENK